ncbi:hypothetical protein EJ02DRAFT_432926 [Clathrospora elynae]|uniref:Cyanovirin-N domain-containing protein n=1 Tax=Clathrospora elynae TaxID=706981 RepID=A0A6A5SYZ4_9PLEO|nr:hypothetical protein EJ02DRAFT_432926 [Clathrospora elynae]
MHDNALAVWLPIFFLSFTSTARYLPPYPPHPSLSSRSVFSLDDKCTFTLYHKQLSKLNYIQLNTLRDHPNDLTIDLSQLRPRTEHNSYAKISGKQVFTVEGLLDNANLTIRGEDGSDVVEFKNGELSWTTERMAEGGEAWCDVGEWDNEMRRSRERKMECSFPCAKIVDEEEEERVELR